jgi:hypothetical protein
VPPESTDSPVDFAKEAIDEAGRRLRPGRRAVVLTISEPTESLPFLGAGRAGVDDESIEALFSAARAGAERTAEEEPGRRARRASRPRPSRGRSGLKYSVIGSAAAVAQHSKRTIFIARRSVSV